MDFFNDLLTSYALLKKRKLSITLDEGVSIDTQGQGEAPSYGAIRSRGGENGNTHADEVIRRTDEHMAKVFPGVDVAATPQPKGEVNDGGNAALVTAPLEPDMKLIAYGAQDQGDTGTESTTNGNGDKKPAKETPPCGRGIVWQTKPNEMVIYRTCKVGGQATSTYRTMVARHFWRGGTNAEDYAENIDPWVMYMQNSREGSHLLSLFKDSPEVISQLTALMRKGWGDGKPQDSFYDPEKASSIFGVLAKTMRTQGQRHINLGTVSDTILVPVIPDEEHTLAALETMVKALDIILRKPIDKEDAQWMHRNLYFVTDEHGEEQLFFRAIEGEETGVNYTAAPGQYFHFLKQFKDFNQLLRDTFAGEKDFVIPSISREVIYDHSDAALASQDVITNVSEEISAIVQMLIGPRSNLTSEERRQRAAEMYHALHEKYGININHAIRATTGLPAGGTALNDEYLALMEAFHQLRNTNDQDERKKLDLDTTKFFEKVEALVTQKVLEADADFVVRVGTGGGEFGFKSDQFYLYKADSDGLARASRFMGVDIDGDGNIDSAEAEAGGFDPTPKSFRDIVRDGVPRHDKGANGGRGHTRSDAEWETAKDAEWARVKELWGVEDDNQEVYIGYDSLKWSSPTKGKNKIATGGGRKLESVPLQLIGDGKPGSPGGSLGEYMNGTLDQDSEEYKWVDGMLGLVGTRGEIDPKTSEVIPGTDYTEQVADNLRSLRDTNDTMASLQNTQTQSLTVSQVRAELWHSIQNIEELNLTKKEVNSLIQGGERPDAAEVMDMGNLDFSPAEDSSQGVPFRDQNPLASKESLLVKAARDRVQRALWFNRIKQGLNDPDPKVRKGWQHTVAILQLQQAYDTNNAWDTIADGKNNRTARHKRDETLKKILDPFMADGTPDEVSSRISWGRGGGYSIKGEGGSLGYSFDSKGQVDTSFTPDESYWDPIEQNSSTEYSSKELMNKLLEVQQLMFTHLIKE